MVLKYNLLNEAWLSWLLTFLSFCCTSILDLRFSSYKM